MGTVHRLNRDHGKDVALRSDIDRRVIEAAAAYLSDEDSEIGFLYSGWASAALPHKRLPDDQHWEVRTDRATLIVQPGLKATPGAETVHVGVALRLTRATRSDLPSVRSPQDQLPGGWVVPLVVV